MLDCNTQTKNLDNLNSPTTGAWNHFSPIDTNLSLIQQGHYSRYSSAQEDSTEMVLPTAANFLYGDLSYGDYLNPLRNPAYMDDYRYTMERAGQVKFNLDSNDFDTYLQVIDYNTGQLIGFDDNSGFGTNSEITINFQSAGDIIVRVTSYYAYDIGYYRLGADAQYSSSPYPTPPNPNPGTIPFNSNYGYGLVDAAALVAKAIGQQPFPQVRDLGGNDWSNDLVKAPEVWAKGYTGKDIIVAVVDTGVDYTHPDLDNNIWRNFDEIFGNGLDDDRNGYIDDVIGWDFVGRDNNPMDEQSHGTHVAGTIAAENNGFGVTGVAYNAKIMPIRVLGQNGGSGDWISRGIRYAADNGANVINLSLGGGFDQLIIDAVRYASQKGAIVVMAAGNDSKSQPGYPAAIATEVGITVGAVDRNLYMADFSNRAGSDPAMRYVVAPGKEIVSTVPGGGYTSLNGTSMAAPHVAGVVALMLSANPNLTPTQVRQMMIETAFRGNGQQSNAFVVQSRDAAMGDRPVVSGDFDIWENSGSDWMFERDWEVEANWD
jgi:subtilisin family serine protease